MDKENKEQKQEQKAPASYQEEIAAIDPTSDFIPSDSGSSYENQKGKSKQYKHKCEFRSGRYSFMHFSQF